MNPGEETLPHGFVRSNPNYASWIAAGAVLAGAVGATLACVQHYSGRRRRRWPRKVTSQDSHAVNPPHGDKLLQHM